MKVKAKVKRTFTIQLTYLEADKISRVLHNDRVLPANISDRECAYELAKQLDLALDYGGHTT